MKQLLFFLCLSIFYSTDLFACSCAPLSQLTQQEYEEAGEIFIGRVSSVQILQDSRKKLVTFEIINQLKPTTAAKTFIVKTPLHQSACGLSFNKGEKWYLFGYYTKEGDLWADTCGRSVNISKPKGVGFKTRFFTKTARKNRIKRYRKEKRIIKKLSCEKAAANGIVIWGRFGDSQSDIIITC